MAKKIGIFHIDDHKIFTEGMHAMLREEPQISWLGSATTLGEGLKQCRQLKPDLVLLDYFLPDGNGLDAADILMKDLPTVHLLMLTMENSPSIIDKCKQAGLGGCLQKTIGKVDMMAAIQKVMQHLPVFPQPSPQAVVRQDNTPNNISRREKEIAILVAKGLTSAEIADKLHLSVLTINTHRRNIMRKLNVKNLAQWAMVVGEWGK